MSIIEHEGITLVKFLPGTSIEAISQKIVDLGYSPAEFKLIPKEEPGLVDFRVFSDEEFPLYLCLSQIFHTFPFTQVTIQGEVFPHDVKEIEENGGRLFDALEISFADALGTDRSSQILQAIGMIAGLESTSVSGSTIWLPIVQARAMHEIVQLINRLVRIDHVRGTFAFNLDVEG